MQRSGSDDEERRFTAQSLEDVVHGLTLRLRLPWLLRHHRRRPMLALFTVLNSCVSLGILTGLAILTQTPFVFPSLGPTAFLQFYRPLAAASSPRNTLLGHALGTSSGYLGLMVTGLTTSPSSVGGMSWRRAAAVGIALAVTAGLMVLTRTEHPPAISTALLVALGSLTAPWQLLLIMAAVLLLTVQALLINRAAGIPYPTWAAHERRAGT